jgi:hypothetical protein
MNASQAVVLSTHILSAKIYNHFIRLKAETKDSLDVYLCARKPIKYYDAIECPVDFSISRRDEKKLAPKRYVEMKKRGGTIVPGFSDLASMPALLSNRLGGYNHIWLIEYDVDFAGAWQDFFAGLISSDADLMGTTFYPRTQCPEWYHWPWFETPPEVSVNYHVRSFGPVVRFSRRLMNCYVDAMRDGRWRGHNEAIYPTLALYNGFTIQDLGGYGPFTPVPLRGRSYCNTPTDKHLSPGTFIFRPVEHKAYFPDAPEQFPARGFLYHPVKVHDEVVGKSRTLAKVARISSKLGASILKT